MSKALVKHPILNKLLQRKALREIGDGFQERAFDYCLRSVDKFLRLSTQAGEAATDGQCREQVAVDALLELILKGNRINFAAHDTGGIERLKRRK